MRRAGGVSRPSFPATFYGQQAIATLGKTDVQIAFTSPQDPPAVTDSFEPELIRAVKLLHRHGQKKLITPFLRQLTRLSYTRDERFAVIDLANQVGLPHEAVRTAKRIAQLDTSFRRPAIPYCRSTTPKAAPPPSDKERHLLCWR